MALFKKFGSFGSAAAKAAKSIFGGSSGGKATLKTATKRGSGGTSSPPPPSEPVGGTLRDNPLTTGDFQTAMQQASAETSRRIEEDIARRFGPGSAVSSATSSTRSESLYETYREELAKEAREDLERRTRWVEEKQRNFSPLMKFLYGEIVEVSSTNVQYIQYDRDRQLLYIAYKNGAWYVYYDVDGAEAESLFVAPSAGGWVWDHLRVRKTAWGYKKLYAFLEYNLAGGYQPRYMSDAGYQKEHATIAPTGEPPASWKVAGSGLYSDLPWYSRNPGKDADPHQLPVAKLFEEPASESKKRA